MTGTLYVVATPIGNLGDMSPRAIDVLRNAHLVAAEDTRIFAQLAAALGLDKSAVSYHKFNEMKSADGLVDALLSGKHIALVSDAGTPCISDPGHILVARAVRAGISVEAIPGPSAVPAALAISGFEVSHYTFRGFFPRKKQAEVLDELEESPCRITVFYESPRRIADTMALLASRFPQGEICLCNDLTKRYQRVYRGSPGQVQDELLANPAHEKGEYTLVLSLPPLVKGADIALCPEALLTDVWIKEGCTLKEAVALTAQRWGLPKKQIYDASLKLKALLGGCTL